MSSTRAPPQRISSFPIWCWCWIQGTTHLLIILMCAGSVAPPCCSGFIPWDQKLTSFWKRKTDLFGISSWSYWSSQHTEQEPAKQRPACTTTLRTHERNPCEASSLWDTHNYATSLFRTSPSCPKSKLLFQRPTFLLKRGNVSVITSLMTEFSQDHHPD